MITVISISLLLLPLIHFLCCNFSPSLTLTHTYLHTHPHTHTHTRTQKHKYIHTHTNKKMHTRTNTHPTISSALDLLSKFSVPYLFNYETILPFNATSSLAFQLKNPFDLLKLFSFRFLSVSSLVFGLQNHGFIFSLSFSFFIKNRAIFFSNILVVSVCRQGNNDCLRSDRNHGSLRSPSSTSSTTASATS